jgi:hypothetical protein
LFREVVMLRQLLVAQPMALMQQVPLLVQQVHSLALLQLNLLYEYDHQYRYP